MKRFFFFLFCSWLFIQLHAQSKTRVQVYLKTGDRITGYCSVESFKFTTAYGTLQIPFKNVVSLHLGQPVWNAPPASVASLIKKVQSAPLPEARLAFDSLVNGDATTASWVKTYLSDPGYSPRPHPEINLGAALEILIAANGLASSFSVSDQLKLKDQNQLEGNCELQEIKIETAWGNLLFDRMSLAAIIPDAMQNAPAGTFEIPAAFYSTARGETGWLNTGMIAKAGQTIRVKCSGSVVLESLSGKKLFPDGRTEASPENQNGPMADLPIGAVSLRMGLNGKSVFALKPGGYKTPATGVVYLSIRELEYRPLNTGSYTCTVAID